MIYKNKQEGEIQGYYIGAEDNSRYCICVCIFFFFFSCDELNVNEWEQSLLSTGIRFEVQRSTWAQIWAD